MIFSELSLCSVGDRNSGSCWEPSSRVELHEWFLAKRLLLSVDVVRTSGPLKRYSRFPPVKNAVTNPQEVTGSDKLKQQRDELFQHNWTSHLRGLLQWLRESQNSFLLSGVTTIPSISMRCAMAASQVWTMVRAKLKLSVRNVAVNTDLDPLSYLLSSIGGIVLKDIKPRHIPKMIPRPNPVSYTVRVDSTMVRLDNKLHINAWLPILARSCAISNRRRGAVVEGVERISTNLEVDIWVTRVRVQLVLSVRIWIRKNSDINTLPLAVR